MTVSLEKIFFAYILENKRFMPIVDKYFFKNREIEFVYGVIRTYMLSKDDVSKPSPRQILEMVKLEDKEDMISKEILKSMLSVELKEYDDKFILPRLKGWIMSNRTKNAIVDIIDISRDIDGSMTDLDSVTKSVDKIREIVDKASNVNVLSDDDEDLGSDFDDVESHSQDTATDKRSSGFVTLDHILGGGFDTHTLNVLMAETSNGKSLWMQNLTVRAANMGSNVLYITLEMTEKKVMKRLGAMRLSIPINEYDNLSQDTNYMKERIESLKKTTGGGFGDDLFEKKVGKIYCKFWAAGTKTVHDFDEYIAKLQDKKGIKIDLIVVDYISLMSVPKNQGGDSLYTKGKFASEGLRALGAKYKCPVITAVQVAKDAWNSTDITLESVPESKSIAECADTFFAIIRNAEMKRQNLYRLKLLKQRDGDFSKSMIMLNLNPIYLTLEDDRFIDM